MKQVPLRSRKYPGLKALVDDTDYDRVVTYNWWPQNSKHTFYAATRIRGVLTLLHRFVLAVPGEVDHRDGDGLNCQRGNLREADDYQQNRNRSKQTTPLKNPVFKGVSPCPRSTRNPWRAMIRLEGKNRHIGVFPTPEEAARAYDIAARSAFGEFAKLNF